LDNRGACRLRSAPSPRLYFEEQNAIAPTLRQIPQWDRASNATAFSSAPGTPDKEFSMIHDAQPVTSMIADRKIDFCIGWNHFDAVCRSHLKMHPICSRQRHDGLTAGVPSHRPCAAKLIDSLSTSRNLKWVLGENNSFDELPRPWMVASLW
jgi:hypothetical protein